MKNKVLDKLVCPICSTPDKSDSRLGVVSDIKVDASPKLFCNKCKTYFSPLDGIFNLAGNFVAPKLLSSQWAMEFGPLVAAYDKIWRPIVTSIVCNLTWEMETSRQLMALSSGMDVLDLACGTGNFTRLFSALARPGVVIGVDLSLPMLKKGMCQLSKQKNNDITLMRVDVTKWPFAPETFDRIHCAGALHLFPDILNVFHSIYRSLKKGGDFVGSTYCRGGNVVSQGIQKYISTVHGFHWFEPQELQNLASRTGFSRWEQQTYKQGIVFKAQKS